MAQVVNDTDKLTLILTDYGLSRIAEALADPTVTLTITKIKVGDANFEYYVPEAKATSLIHEIENGSFYIIEKDLLEDNLTVSFHAIIPENFDNCEIREVGLYETVNGVDYLFAISTQQPLLKPSTELRYFLTVDYYTFLKSANLAEVYDQIQLDPDNQIITQDDFDNLMSTIIFTESNMMEQINGNSRMLGYNRAQQLHDKIVESRRNYGNKATSGGYSLILNNINAENLYSYWIFDYPRRTSSDMVITDISPYGRNLDINKSVNSFETVYSGLIPMLSFSDEDYFYMPQRDSLSELNLKDFTIVGSLDVDRGGTASGFSENSYATLPSLSVDPNGTYSIIFNFYLGDISENQTVLYTSTNYSLVCYIDILSSKCVVRLGDGLGWRETLSFPVSVAQEYTARILFNSNQCSLETLKNGTFIERDYVNTTLNLPTTLGNLVLGAPYGTFEAFKSTMELKPFEINVNGSILYSGSTYSALNNLSLVNPNGTEDVSFAMFFVLQPLTQGVDRTLIARSNYSTNAHIFEVTETEHGALRVRLFSDSTNFLTFQSANNIIPFEPHTLGIGYDATNKIIHAYLGNRRISMRKILTGRYTHMNNTPSTLYAYTYTEKYEVYSNSVSVPSKLYNKDGSPNTDPNWSISDNIIFYKDDITSYDPEKNVQTDLLYAWDSYDGALIYTKIEDNLQPDTPLYNEDYTLYEGHDFGITWDEASEKYAIYYKVAEYLTEYSPENNIEPKTLYYFSFSYPMQTIWANNSQEPTTLYQANGDTYSGDDWTIVSNEVLYKNGGIASYNSLYNLIVPTIPITSYVIDSLGNMEKPIISNVGLISVVKEYIPEENLRAIVLNLDSLIGHNPCIKEY